MTYSIDIKNLIINKLINNVPKNNISKTLNISLSTINNWSYKYKDNINNKTYLVKDIIINHGLNKKNAYINSIKTYVANNEGCVLNDIKNSINNMLSNSTICRILKENKITRKKINNRIVCKDINKIKESRNIFANNNHDEQFLNYISIDESSFCITDINKYGYSKAGKEIKKMYKHKANKERISLLAAINKQKIIAYTIFSGSLNAEGYRNFITANKELFINKTIIQDNVRLHHSRIVKQYAIDNNIKLEYIPAYTPEFNPIEQVFNQIKIEFRKKDHYNMTDDIEKSLLIVNENHLNNYFNNTLKVIKSYKTL